VLHLFIRNPYALKSSAVRVDAIIAAIVFRYKNGDGFFKLAAEISLHHHCFDLVLVGLQQRRKMGIGSK
jgi:hypothetical protein